MSEERESPETAAGDFSIDQALTAAESLEGQTLPGGWTVNERVHHAPGHTGGNFSITYLATSPDGSPAFLKVLDYEAALFVASGDPAEALNLMTRAYLFEVDVLKMCGERRLSRVVRALDNGDAFIDGPTGKQRVSYLVFEIADGDVRDAIDATEKIDHAWRLRVLHHATNGVRQLHSRGVAHQDVKPSNVLVFDNNSSKIADLGCASVRETPSPRDGHPIAGDHTYAPPELLYGQVDPDWSSRRLACDLFHVGSLATYLFAGQGMTSLLLQRLAPVHHPSRWGESYADVLPFVRVAFDKAVEDFAEACPPEVKDELVVRVRELCEPDPTLRGHPRNRRTGVTQYSLERYVSSFDKLARIAEIRMRAA